jgi:radical SAM protein with 4Fe4S-binding SPASM domain
MPWMLEKLAGGETPKYFPYAKFIKDQENGGPPPRISPFKCGACRGTTTVGADGTLYPCHRFVGMQAWRIGDMANGPDYDKCMQFWRDYRATIAPACESCWLWTQCKGPCPWEIANADGTFKTPGASCRHMEKYVERAAYFHFTQLERKTP